MRTNQEFYHLFANVIPSDNPNYYSFTMDSSKMVTLSYSIPCLIYNQPRTITIDWGDSTQTVVNPNTLGDQNPSHTYTKNTGMYIIKITTSDNYLEWSYTGYNGNTNNDYYKTLITVNSPFLKGVSNHPLASCTALTTIPSNLFINNDEVVSFNHFFYKCSLTTIPSDLFKYNIYATDFGYCFSTCYSLTAIPTDLFIYNILATNFRSCFQSCTALTTIPEYLFRYNLEATDFSSCFQPTRNITINPNIFCDPTTEKTTRFAGKTIDFSTCFLRGTTTFTGVQGTAPDLWNYTFGSVTTHTCFGGHSIESLSNWDNIPYEWRQ